MQRAEQTRSRRKPLAGNIDTACKAKPPATNRHGRAASAVARRLHRPRRSAVQHRGSHRRGRRVLPSDVIEEHLDDVLVLRKKDGHKEHKRHKSGILLVPLVLFVAIHFHSFRG